MSVCKFYRGSGLHIQFISIWKKRSNLLLENRFVAKWLKRFAAHWNGLAIMLACIALPFTLKIMSLNRCEIGILFGVRIIAANAVILEIMASGRRGAERSVESMVM